MRPLKSVPIEVRMSRVKSSDQRFHASACACASSAAAMWNCESTIGGASAVGAACASASAGKEKSAATSAGRGMRFIVVPSFVFESIEKANGERLALRGIQHLGTHRLRGPIGGDRQSPRGEKGAWKFGGDHGGAGFLRDALERPQREEGRVALDRRSREHHDVVAGGNRP